MEIKPEHAERLRAALEYADEQFWAVIAARFRDETKSGDFPPDLTYWRKQHNEEDVLWWLQYNAPQLLVGGEEKQAQSRLDQLLDKKNKTDLEEMELERLLRDYAQEHGITYDRERGYE